MSRAARGIVAFVLAVVFGGVPLAADWCAVSCEAEATATATMAGVPPCHHSESSTTRVSGAGACGHDHRGIILIATATPSAVKSFPFTSTAVAVPIVIVRPVTMVGRAGPDRWPPTVSIPLALASALRI